MNNFNQTDVLKKVFNLAVSSLDNIDQLYLAFLKIGCDVLAMPSGIISFIEEHNYQILASYPGTYPVKKDDVSPLGDTYFSQAIEKDQTVYYQHVGSLEEHTNSPAVFNGMGLEAYISTPVKVRGKLFGTLNFSDAKPRDSGFSETEIEFIEQLAQSLGHVIGRNQLQKEHHLATERMQENIALFEGAFSYAAIGMALVGIDGKWLRVNESLCDIVGYSREELLKLDFQSITHPDDLNIDLQNVKDLIEGKCDNYRMKKRYLNKDGDVIWVLLAASLVRGSDGSPRYFISQIEDISKQVIAEDILKDSHSELINTNKQLLKLVRIDSLTGLSNRREMEEQLSRVLKYSARYLQPLAVIVIDVDYFKQYNDKFGHLEGDKALVTISKVLKEASRDSDIIARFGGEEFIALLPKTNHDQASIVADRFRLAIERIDTLRTPVTISLGVSSCRPEILENALFPTEEQLIKAADAALYIAKAEGRNCVAMGQELKSVPGSKGIYKPNI